ncbi:glycosyltransferase family 2 protein [Nesterenkonia sp. NBAIMH1]|uniref:glycosyltransferase family 2 protein n=1 Tax=Nesterenkonia sp. NBAIMH1 TaxID=2600320 RepID=UPI0011B47F17|nr:glycosyltransferase family 2 protein [Nesterenkonia sp. NBAIMH1]
MSVQTRELGTPALLQAYADQVQGRGRALAAVTLRSESVQMREILAHRATHGTLTQHQLEHAILHGTVSAYSLEPQWTARLCRVVALQNQNQQDTDFAIAGLRLILPHLLIGEQHRYGRLLAEMLIELRRFDEVLDVLESYPTLRRAYHGYLRVDATNPWARGHSTSRPIDRWLRGFNRPFTQTGLLPLTISSGAGVPFNRLSATIPAEHIITDGPLVTVIMTTFQPERADALQSARSILNQTWQNLELLIVDDASPEAFRPVLDELERLDPRVRVLRLESNGGTYRARNTGIRQARGEYIAGQDADDFSHPQRIAQQVQQLENHPSIPGNQVYTLNMSEDLVRTRRGYHPFIPSAPAVMYRAEILRAVGGYLPARKAADNELLRRISTYAGTPVARIKDPLIFMRILPDSLSRADFRPGWQHPARRAFWSAYKYWHQVAAPEELALNGEASPIHVPTRFTQAPEEPSLIDVLVIADWCEYGESQLTGIDEIHTLLEAGYRVGVQHQENAVHLAEHSRMLLPEIQQLINDGRITCVLDDETHHSIGTVLVRSPQLLQFMPHKPASFTPARLIVTADSAPFEPGETWPGYLADDAAKHAEKHFGLRPTWIPGSARIRELLEHEIPGQEIHAQPAAATMNPEGFAGARRRRRGVRPVIGRWAGTGPEEWPRGASAIEQVLPTDGSVDIRLYGDPSSVLRTLGLARLPAHWLCFDPVEISRAAYTRMLDFYPHQPQKQPAGRYETPVLEAMAAGCIVILPPSFENLYGDAAVYAEPGETQQLIRDIWGDSQRYVEQSARSVAFVRAQDPQAYREQMQTLIEPAQEHAVL